MTDFDATTLDVGDPVPPDEQPAISAEDPAPQQGDILNPAALYVYYFSIITGGQGPLGGVVNKLDKQQYVLRAMDHALTLTAWSFKR